MKISVKICFTGKQVLDVYLVLILHLCKIYLVPHTAECMGLQIPWYQGRLFKNMAHLGPLCVALIGPRGPFACGWRMSLLYLVLVYQVHYL